MDELEGRLHCGVPTLEDGVVVRVVLDAVAAGDVSVLNHLTVQVARTFDPGPFGDDRTPAEVVADVVLTADRVLLTRLQGDAHETAQAWCDVTDEDAVAVSCDRRDADLLAASQHRRAFVEAWAGGDL